MEHRLIIELLVVGTGIIIIFCVVYIILLITANKKQNRLHAEKQQLQISLLGESERTMNEIAEVIHGHLAQILSMAQMNLKAACDEPDPEKTVSYIQRADKLLSEIGDRFEVINKSLNSQYIQTRGLSGVLHTELEYLTRNCGIYCHLEVSGIKRKLPPDKELLLYRIVHEAVFNAVKYSRASDIAVHFNFSATSLKVAISDNGIGMQPENIVQGRGTGLINMRHRVELLGAVLKIETAPGKGAQLSLTCSI